MKKITSSFFFILFIVFYSSAQNNEQENVIDSNSSSNDSAYTSQITTYTVETVPNTKVADNSYVSDPNHFLQQETLDEINSLLSALEKKTTDQVEVVVLNSIGEEDHEAFANRLFNKWGIGVKGKDNGLLILMVMDQRKVRFETGYGMEGMLPDALCKRIEQKYMVPEFKNGNYDQGILEGVKVTCDILSNPENSKIAEELKSAVASEARADRLVMIFVFGLFYVVFALAIYFYKRHNKTFKENFNTSKGVKSAAISQKKWLIIYCLVPFLYGLYMYLFYTDDDFMIAFLFGDYLILMFFFIEKRVRLNQSLAKTNVEGDYYKNYTKYKKSHAYWWTAALFFPLFIPYMIYAERKKQVLRNHPRNCKSCANPLHKLNEQEDDQYLKKTELLEENLKSVDYDVWLCKNCEAKEVYAFPNTSSNYAACAKCGIRSYYLLNDQTTTSATYSHSGKGLKTYFCKNCHYKKEEVYTIPKKVQSSSSSYGGSSGSGSSGGGSFGGGSSGGGGSSSSW
jgi:uncharacterized protein